ncbi:hypothetical protein [Nocardia sp. NPDC004711]
MRKALGIDLLALGLTGEAEAFDERLIGSGSGSHPDPTSIPTESEAIAILEEARRA